MMFYSGLGRKVEVNRLKWKVLNAQKIRNNREKNLMKSTLFLSSTLCWWLLAIVLVTASFISQGKIKVNVPKASSTVAFKSDELTKLLTVTADKQLYF